jgi:hypothetical protein
MSYTTLNEMRREVEGRRVFKGNSVFSEVTENFYTVYSYGYHFPMYVYDYALGDWIGNSDKYSTSTSRQQSKCRPNNVRHWLDTSELKHMIPMGGFVQYKTAREI